MENNPLPDLLEFVKDNGRVCPIPSKWNALWKKLPDRKQNADGGWTPPLPLILAAWHFADEQDKAKCLKGHILKESAFDPDRTLETNPSFCFKCN